MESRMRRRHRPLVLRLPLLAGLALPAVLLDGAIPGPSPREEDGGEIDTLALEGHARFLAHDLLEGRGPASRGERLAALYLTTRLSRLGLRPLPGRDGYGLPVPLTAVHVDRSSASVRLPAPEEPSGGSGGAVTLRPPAFYHPGGSGAAFRDFGAELVLAGAAAGARAALEGVDLAGKVAVVTPPWDGLAEVEAELLRRGAAGAVSLIPNGDFYDRLRIVRGPTRYHLPDGVDDPANQSPLPRVVGGPELIGALGLEEAARPGARLDRARPLGRRIEVELPHATERRTGFDVAGWLPGADPALRDEWVAYVAHYDGVGFGEPTAGDSIWNGFIDNAAGCATLLEIARAMAARPPARSVLFLFVTAEEQGLLGSNWFVHEPPIPLERIRAVLNVDGGAPPAPPTEWGLVRAAGSALGATARDVIEGHGWTVDARDPGPQSDHWPFHRAGVPALMLFPGSELEGLSGTEAEALTRRWHHAHTPDDEWHPDFPFSGLRRYAELALEIGRALARPKAPPDA